MHQLPDRNSMGPSKLRYFVLGTSNVADHKYYWNGTAGQPATKYQEELKGKFTSPLAAASWSTNRIDALGCGADLAHCHKYFGGTGWQP